LMEDGRILYSSWQHSTLEMGPRGRVSLFGINLDGTDLALFSAEGKPVKMMPCVTSRGLAVFVESFSAPWDGSGQLAAVALRRNLHSYRTITQEEEGLFHSPSPLPDGRILVSQRPVDGSATHGIRVFDPETGDSQLVYDDPESHDIQAKLVCVRTEADGRSSVVTEKDPHGQLFCLNVYLSDLENAGWLPNGEVKRVRLLEGIPASVHDTDSSTPLGTGILPKRLLGEIPVEEDGSFFVQIPANVPVQLQTLDERGMALRTCSWIWVKNHEPRGCIGCHEDGELTPENRLVDAVTRPPRALTLPPHRRRTVDFKHQVAPILHRKCASSQCHGNPNAAFKLAENLPSKRNGDSPTATARRAYTLLMTPASSSEGSHYTGRFVHPGRARTSPLIWHIMGRNTSRPWDKLHLAGESVRSMVDVSAALTEEEQRTLVEWIDLGAYWDTRSLLTVTKEKQSGGSGQ
jgi:hypothetical protein